jgi:hypothetical protein
MEYPLAKQLKECGFPQDGKYRTIDRHVDGTNPPMNMTFVAYEKATDCCFVPSLSELIEACGEEFGGLVWRQTASEENGISRQWIAFPFMARDCEHLGSSPEVAVAKLYIALHT